MDLLEFERIRRELGRAYVARRRRLAMVCVICGATRLAYPGAQYCSNRCAQRAKYARARAQRHSSVTDIP